MSGLVLNPSSVGGVTFPTFIVLRASLISESKFVVSSVGACELLVKNCLGC
jgi:hypothetical protein